jgi:hypothetical protein
MLTDIPPALHDGHTGFGDDFKVLPWSAPIERYAQASEWPSDAQKQSAFRVKSRKRLARSWSMFDSSSRSPTPVRAPPPSQPRLQTIERVRRASHDGWRDAHRHQLRCIAIGPRALCTAGFSCSCLRWGGDHVSGRLIHHGITKSHQTRASSARERAGWRQGAETSSELRGIVYTLNTVRNNQSMAHPTDDLLGEPEAMLVINAIRTLMHYLDARLR